jgi:hypothetical protein
MDVDEKGKRTWRLLEDLFDISTAFWPFPINDIANTSGLWALVLAKSSNERDGLYFALTEKPDIFPSSRN